MRLLLPIFVITYYSLLLSLLLILKCRKQHMISSSMGKNTQPFLGMNIVMDRDTMTYLAVRYVNRLSIPAGHSPIF